MKYTRVFLTGGRGMVGRNILEHPSSKNYYFLAPTSNDLDLLDRNAIIKFLLKEKPDIIIHSAGVVGGIQANIANPVDFLSKNTNIGINLISSAAQAGVGSLINLGSSCMYPRNARNPLNEELILQGQLEPTNEGYALAKIVSARLCEYIAREDPTKKYKTVIPCNLYGAYDKYGESNSHLIPAIIHKLYEAKRCGLKRVSIWGDGLARREFMTAKDFADFIFFALSRISLMPQNLNVGLGHDYSINEYYRVVANVVGFEGAFENDVSKPVGMQQKLVDITKLNEFGWSYRTELEDGIREACSFYMKRLTHGI